MSTGVVAIALLALRLRYGIDVLDESYYAASAYRFALGGRPLLDDLSTHQFAAFIMSPVARAWLHLTGGSDGLILALRAVYLLASVAAAAVAFEFLRRVFDRRIALLAAIAAVGLVPLLVFAPSYNSIAMLSVSVATSLLGIALLDPRRHWLLAVSGAFFTLAAVAYPTLAPLVLFSAVVVSAASRSWKGGAFVGAGALLTAGAFAVLMRESFGGVGDFFAYQSFARGLGGLEGPGKLAVIARGVVGATYLAPAAWVLAVIAGYRLLHRPVPRLLVVALPVLSLLVIHVDLPVNRTVGVATLALLGALVSGTRCSGMHERRAMMSIFVIGVSAGALMSYTSLAGFTAFGFGAAGVGAPAIAVLLHNAQSALFAGSGEHRAMRATVIMGSLVVMGLVAMCWESTPHGSSPLELRAHGIGAYEGLIGEAEKVDLMTDMRSDLLRVTDADDRLLVYVASSSTYLLTPALPAGPNLSSGEFDGADPAKAEFVVEWLETDDHRPTVVLVDGLLWDERETGSTDHLRDYIDSTYVAMVTRSEYVILVRR